MYVVQAFWYRAEFCSLISTKLVWGNPYLLCATFVQNWCSLSNKRYNNYSGLQIAGRSSLSSVCLRYSLTRGCSYGVNRRGIAKMWLWDINCSNSWVPTPSSEEDRSYSGASSNSNKVQRLIKVAHNAGRARQRTIERRTNETDKQRMHYWANDAEQVWERRRKVHKQFKQQAAAEIAPTQPEWVSEVHETHRSLSPLQKVVDRKKSRVSHLEGMQDVKLVETEQERASRRLQASAGT